MVTLVLLVQVLTACATKTDLEYQADVVVSIHDWIGEDLAALERAAHRLQAAAPSRAWKAEADDAVAIAEMREEWKNARTAYEHIEGALAALVPASDVVLDGRYEDAATRLAGGDGYAFDARGFIGMHAIERILFSPHVRPEVLAFERTLPEYRAPAYPATDDEAISFKTVLVGRFVDDVVALRKHWEPAGIDAGAAYLGLMGLMSEQKEKVNLAVMGKEESRYANITLFDLRSNVDGTKQVYGMFRAWIMSKAAAEGPDAKVLVKLAELADAYATLASDALPEAPPDWMAPQPTDENLATPFGSLWKTVHESVDPKLHGSMVFEMNQVAAVLGLPAFVEE
jgi:iron uptake system component EfeO